MSSYLNYKTKFFCKYYQLISDIKEINITGAINIDFVYSLQIILSRLLIRCLKKLKRHNEGYLNKVTR